MKIRWQLFGFWKFSATFWHSSKQFSSIIRAHSGHTQLQSLMGDQVNVFVTQKNSPTDSIYSSLGRDNLSDAI